VAVVLSLILMTQFGYAGWAARRALKQRPDDMISALLLFSIGFFFGVLQVIFGAFLTPVLWIGPFALTRIWIMGGLSVHDLYEAFMLVWQNGVLGLLAYSVHLIIGNIRKPQPEAD
jgi:hypothetical protein